MNNVVIVKFLNSLVVTFIMTKAVYAGSFDPLTNGHLWMIDSASRVFDELVVSIGVNSDKVSVFSLDERLEMIRRSTNHLSNVVVDEFSRMFLVKYAGLVGADFVVRGIRGVDDYGVGCVRCVM